jgi:hypothetical protein
MISPFRQPNYTSDSGSACPIAIDDAIAVLARAGAAFAPHESDPPDMKMRLRAGFVPRLDALPIAVAAQETDALSAPAADSRHDIVHVDRATGAIGVAAGTAAAEPEDPAVPEGKTPIARVRLAPAQTEVVNADLDDLRDWWWGFGSAVKRNVGTGPTEIPTNDNVKTVPTGGMIDYAGAGTVPDGYLLCDGSNVSRESYADLFAVIGETWGAGDGSTTFGLPDSRRRVSVSAGGTGSVVLGNEVGDTGGSEDAIVVSHSHTTNATQNGAPGQVGDGSSGPLGGPGAINSAGERDTGKNVQPAYVVQKIIKT